MKFGSAFGELNRMTGQNMRDSIWMRKRKTFALNGPASDNAWATCTCSSQNYLNTVRCKPSTPVLVSRRVEESTIQQCWPFARNMPQQTTDELRTALRPAARFASCLRDELGQMRPAARLVRGLRVELVQVRPAARSASSLRVEWVQMWPAARFASG